MLPLAMLSSHNSSARSEAAERSSLQSIGLEQDNESLRSKLRQIRDDNARFVSQNNELQTELETARYELHRSSNKIQSLEQASQRHASDLCAVRESMDVEKKRLEHELSEWKCRADEACEAARRSADTVQQLHSQLEEFKNLRRRVEGTGAFYYTLSKNLYFVFAHNLRHMSSDFYFLQTYTTEKLQQENIQLNQPI